MSEKEQMPDPTPLEQIAEGREKLRIAEISGESKADYQTAMNRYAAKWRDAEMRNRQLTAELATLQNDVRRLVGECREKAEKCTDLQTRNMGNFLEPVAMGSASASKYAPITSNPF